ncbi:MAG: sodium/proline symporter [Synergistaceae bacterium]|nr:sodium/proline symporter [Synergistaceae bacterium]
MNVSVVVLALYLGVLITVGFIAGRKVKSGKDYAIGGRNIPGWAAALSERATDCSAWMLLGVPGSAYALGMSSIWAAVGCLIGSAGAWWLVSNQLRKQSADLDAVTYIDWIAKRHSANAKGIRVFGSLTIIFFFTLYISAQLIGGGKTFFSLFGLDTTIGILITSAVVVSYTMYGGFGSVVYTDCLQAVMLFSALLLGTIFGFGYIASNPEVYASSIGAAWAKAGGGYGELFRGAEGIGKGVVFGNGMAWMFAYLGGLPQLNTRFMSMKDEKAFQSGRIISVSYIVLSYICAILVGFVGFAIFGPGIEDTEQIMPNVMKTLFHPALATLFITGGIAAMLSTADSLLALTSAEVAEDIVKPYFMKGKELSSRASLRISRLITIGLAVLAIIFAFILPKTLIFTMVSYVWAGLGSPFAVVTLLSIYWKKYTAKAALWTIIVGLFFTIFWIASGLDAKVTAMLVGFVASLLTGVTVSLCTQEK